jgi:hypothetical protein
VSGLALIGGCGPEQRSTDHHHITDELSWFRCGGRHAERDDHADEGQTKAQPLGRLKTICRQHNARTENHEERREIYE